MKIAAPALLALILSACAAQPVLVYGGGHTETSVDASWVNTEDKAQVYVAGMKLMGWGDVETPDEESLGCIRTPKGFDGVVIFGTFADDLGCEQGGVFVGGRFYRGVLGGSKGALASAGWASADGGGRQKLAKAWVEVVARVVGRPLMGGSEGVEAASVSSEKGGGVHVRVWVSAPVDHRRAEAPRRDLHLLDYEFDAEGALVRVMRLERRLD